MIRHKWADVIHAYAEGAEIQIKHTEDEWLSISNPCFEPTSEYRIKPKIVKKEGWVNVYASDFCTAEVSYAYPSKESADINKSHGRIACIRIEWEEEE